MRQAGPQTGVLRLLDGLLSEAQRRAPAERVSRARVLVGATLFLLAMDTLFVVSAPLYSLPWVRAGVGLVAGAGFLAALVLQRRRGASRLPAVLVCAMLTGAIVVVTVAIPKPAVAAHSATMLIPALAVYLLGVRAGLVFTGIFCLNVGLLLPLYLQWGWGDGPPDQEARTWLTGLLNSLILLLGWALSALFSVSRDAASATVRESERKLSSLIESTDDPVCSLGLEGQLLTANSAARGLLQRILGREPRPGDRLDEKAEARVRARWREQLARAARGEPVRYEEVIVVEGRGLLFDLSLNPIPGDDGRPVGVTLFGRDITLRKEAEVKLGELHRSLLEVSRRAGMAEVATGVLHNVGNTLNSVNVSAELVRERLRDSRAPMLARAVALLREHAEALPAFLSSDERGRQLPGYLSAVSGHLLAEREALLEELESLSRNVEHIKAVVSRQQEHARYGGLVERVLVPELLDDALRLHAPLFERLGIHIHREYVEVPPVVVDRHRLLQILVNLLSNARHALLESDRPDKQLTLRVEAVGERLRIAVADNGVGIAPENLHRLFTQGFTTRREGHGFGLHASALAAEELDGRLSCTSGGRGWGATFMIDLPLRREDVTA